MADVKSEERELTTQPAEPPPATETVEEPWIEVKNKKKEKGKEVTGGSSPHPRTKNGGGSGRGGAAPLQQPTADEANKERWNKDEENLRHKMVLKDAFDWDLSLKSPEEAGSYKGESSNDNWRKKLFPAAQHATAQADQAKSGGKPLSLFGATYLAYPKTNNAGKRKKPVVPNSAVLGLVVCSFPSFEVVHECVREVKLEEPSLAGYLSWRETGPLAEAVNELKEKHPELVPQVLLVGGAAVVQYRGFGVAAHLGALVDIPTFGVTTKFQPIEGWSNIRAHKFANEQLQKRGEAVQIIGNSGSVLGAAMKFGEHKEAIAYVTGGHRVTLETAINLIRQSSSGNVIHPLRAVDQRVVPEVQKLEPKILPQGKFPNAQRGRNADLQAGGNNKGNAGKLQAGNKGQPVANGKGGAKPNNNNAGNKGNKRPNAQQGRGVKGNQSESPQDHGQGRKQGRRGQGQGKPKGQGQGQGPKPQGRPRGQGQGGGQTGQHGQGANNQPKKGGNKNPPRNNKGGGQANVWQSKPKAQPTAEAVPTTAATASGEQPAPQQAKQPRQQPRQQQQGKQHQPRQQHQGKQQQPKQQLQPKKQQQQQQQQKQPQQHPSEQNSPAQQTQPQQQNVPVEKKPVQGAAVIHDDKKE